MTVRWGLMSANALLGDWDVARAQYDSGTRLFAPWPEGDEVMMHLEVGRNELERARAIPAAGPINPTMIASLDDPQTALRELHRLYADPVVAEPALNQRDIALWAGHFGDAALALDAMRSLVTRAHRAGGLPLATAVQGDASAAGVQSAAARYRDRRALGGVRLAGDLPAARRRRLSLRLTRPRSVALPPSPSRALLVLTRGTVRSDHVR